MGVLTAALWLRLSLGTWRGCFAMQGDISCFVTNVLLRATWMHAWNTFQSWLNLGLHAACFAFVLCGCMHRHNYVTSYSHTCGQWAQRVLWGWGRGCLFFLSSHLFGCCNVREPAFSTICTQTKEMSLMWVSVTKLFFKKKSLHSLCMTLSVPQKVIIFSMVQM